jgi:NAD(P)-dependent dehydrogenase (short-subunit alcohol dehydrogenase family)
MNNLFTIEKKLIVVTGACGLLGRQHCEAISIAGGIPIPLDIPEKDPKGYACEINKKFGISSIGFEVDVTNENQISNCLEKILTTYGRIDGLINNAANNPQVGAANINTSFSRIENFSLEQWNKEISVGLTGSFLCTKYFGSAINANQNGGSIINISSDLGLIAPDQSLYSDPNLPDHMQPVKPVTYSVIKSGIIGLTRYTSTYWPEKVRCNALCPGGVEYQQSAEFIKNLCQKIPMGRMARIDEYQGAIIFLLSNASSYMNGAILSIDGGRTAW